jgi:hypothetical protein
MRRRPNPKQKAYAFCLIAIYVSLAHILKIASVFSKKEGNFCIKPRSRRVKQRRLRDSQTITSVFAR